MVTHDAFVKEIKDQIFSLGLFYLPLSKYLCRGFKPDIIALVGGHIDDKVYIDAINTRGSLDRDVGALLKLKANLDEANIPYRRIMGICGDKIEEKHLLSFEALIRRTPKFLLIRIHNLEPLLKDLILESALERIEQTNQDKLDWYFQRSCELCGSLSVSTVYREKGKERHCLECGFSWFEPRKTEEKTNT